MKLGFILAGCVVFGLSLGVATGYWQFASSTPDLPTAASPASGGDSSATAPAGGVYPVAFVQDTDFEFGIMEAGTSQTHEFVFHNRGEAPLKLTQGETTCKCTLSQLEDNQIPPGGTGVVKLEWRGEGSGPFRQSASIGTNDPNRTSVTLSVSGEVMQSVTLSPLDLVFSSLAANEPSSGQIKVYSYHTDDLKITGHSFVKPEGAKMFDVHYETLPRERFDVGTALSGVLVTVTSKPGLPLGPIRQKIVLETNLEKFPQVEIPIQGAVTSDISILGADWNANNSILKLGVVESRKGAERTLKIVTRGPHRQDIQFKVVRQHPEFLEVSIGEMKQINNGAVTQVPVTIRVPKGAPAASHTGSETAKLARVVLETNHPEIKEVPIYVQFAVENSRAAAAE